MAHTEQLEMNRDFYRQEAMQLLSNSSDRVKQHIQREFHRVNVELKQIREQYSMLREAYTEGLFQDPSSKQKLDMDLYSDCNRNASKMEEETIVKSSQQSIQTVTQLLKQYEIVARELYTNFRWLFEHIWEHLKENQFKQ